MGRKRLKYLFHSGKNSKLAYYGKSFLSLFLLPDACFRLQRRRLLRTLEEQTDKEYILSRVDYYCKLIEKTPLSVEAKQIAHFHRKGHRSVYFFDSYEYIRYFPIRLRWLFAFGDITEVPVEPAIVKSRPVIDANENSVLLNMDKVRHFVFLKDPIPFTEKCNKVIFRGEIDGKPGRIRFMKRWFGDPVCDVGDVGRKPICLDWKAEMLTLYEHLNYKFIMALEGNDVASNLKWVMSSNSLAVMPRPSFETWFMEGKLIPNYHYVEIKPDYSDLKEQINYYIKHPDEAQEIIRHAHEWVKQFQNKKRERLISLLVLEKYFRLTGQDS